MRKLIFFVLAVFFAANVFGQYTQNQTMGTANTLVSVPANGGLRAALINRTFTDTTAANSHPISTYPFAQIGTTGDGNMWVRNYLATGWVLLGGGTSPSGTFWKVGGNMFPVSAPTRDIGTDATYGGALGLMTNGVVRAIVPNGGFVLDNDTTSNKIFTINPSTKEWGYANWNNGGGGGATPTLQQVLTAGSTLTTSNSIDADENDLDILMSPSTGLFRIWDGTQQYGLFFEPENFNLFMQTNDNNAKANFELHSAEADNTDFSLEATLNSDSVFIRAYPHPYQQYLFGINLYAGRAEVGSRFVVGPDSLMINPLLGRINIDSLRTWSAVADTTYKKPMTWDIRNGRWEYASNWFGGGGSTPTLQQVTDVGATTTNAVQVGTSLTVQGGNDPFVSIKQATTNQEYRLRVGVGTGLSSQSFSLYDATAAATRMVITTGGHLVLGRNDLPAAHSRVLVYGGSNGSNIDALPDSTQLDESNIEVMGADYYGASFTGYGVAMQFNGNANTGSVLGYSKKNFGQLRFTGTTNFIRVTTNASLRFATNNTEKAVLDSNGRFGINVISPSSLLHVNDSEDNTGYVAQFGKAGVLKAAIGTEGNIYMVDMSAPSTPSSGYGTIYVRTDSLRFKNDAGTEFTLGSGGGGGSGITVGTTAIASGTAGRVLFQGSGNVLQQEAEFFWNETNNALQIGSPTAVSGYGMLLRQSDNGTTTGVRVISNNQTAYMDVYYAGLLHTGDLLLQGNTSIRLNTATGVTIGANSAPGAMLDIRGRTMTNSRVLLSQGADVASAAGAITLGGDGNSFEITGTSSITAIVNTNWQNGATITLMFTSTATLTDGTANSGTSIGFELAGNTDFTATADDVITLILSEIGGTQRWREVSRSVN